MHSLRVIFLYEENNATAADTPHQSLAVTASRKGEALHRSAAIFFQWELLYFVDSVLDDVICRGHTDFFLENAAKVILT